MVMPHGVAVRSWQRDAIDPIVQQAHISGVKTKPYIEVRALSRGIALLTELNRLGHARASALARVAGVDRTTAYRMLATLKHLGLVAQRDSDDEYVLDGNVRSLSDGYSHRDHLTRCVSLHLGTLFQQVLWPTDFATFEQNAMVIRETTHRFSPYSVHRAMIGRQRPLFASALGRAFLAGASPTQRDAVIEMAKSADPAPLGLTSPALLDETVSSLIGDFAARGYAWSAGETESHISAIALPIRGPVFGIVGARGAINVLFFGSAMSVEQAADRFLAPLRACINRIEADMATDAFA